ncbi:hypothetical protein [Flavobacterium sp.]|uniref:hypothetical protein n=1 Tax=Flavobacterium sp. TaxID=239 RepID=UPI0026325BB9|nr:hypothetical protein [Flavobacterium sp.]
MKKSILNLGAQELTRNEQKSVNGGKFIPRDEMCICAQVNWGTAQNPGENNGVGMTFSTTYTAGAIPVGFVYIQPTPACCIS